MGVGEGISGRLGGLHPAQSALFSADSTGIESLQQAGDQEQTGGIRFDGVRRPQHAGVGRMREYDAGNAPAYGTAFEYFKVKAGRENRRASALPWVINYLE
ncbi:MAG: hypothetical protein LBV45_07895 [Xanthomonadaceae bacterium]|nr:hypothetical protein [Xanthomonadaceae bacterium]